MHGFELSDFLPYQLAVAAGRVSWRVLAHLAAADGNAVSVREIHARVDMDKSKVSRAAAGLEHAGLIEKRENAEDRRLLDMRLTDKGQALVARIVPIANAYQAELLAQLAASHDPLERALTPEAARALDLPAVNYDEAGFRFALNQDAMATDKLSEGIRNFVTDTEKLEQLILAA